MKDSPRAAGGENGQTAKESRGRPWRSLLGLLLVLLVGLAVWRWGGSLIRLFRDQERVRVWLSQFGPLTPLVSVGLNAAQVLLAPVPGQVVGLANGYLFGVFWGTVYSMLGIILGSALAMGLGRWLGRPVVVRLIGEQQLSRWDGLAARRGPLFFFLVFLLPLVPDDIACFAVGLSPLSIPYILILSTLGRLPGVIVSSWIGARASSLPLVGWALILSLTLALALVVMRYRERIEAALLRLAERWSDGGSPSD